MKPCNHSPDEMVDGCRICHLYAHDPRYRRLWTDVSTAKPASSPTCAHLGEPTGERVRCPSCHGFVQVKLFHCQKYGECTTRKEIEGIACCEKAGGCPSDTRRIGLEPSISLAPTIPEVKEMPALKWSYGVTTVPARRMNLLPRTLASLKRAGFDQPRLFVDGDRDQLSWEKEFGLEVTMRWPRVRIFGAWMLAMGELYLREPMADRYAIFQDDLVTCKGLRRYLERSPYPDKGYLNLYTFQEINERIIRGKERGRWYEASCTDPSRPWEQTGRGAVGLVFDNDAVVALLTSLHTITRPKSVGQTGWRKVDGAIVSALNKAGWREYIHNPSLVQHMGGSHSTIGNHMKQALTFPGEMYDLAEEEVKALK